MKIKKIKLTANILQTRILKWLQRNRHHHDLISEMVSAMYSLDDTFVLPVILTVEVSLASRKLSEELEKNLTFNKRQKESTQVSNASSTDCRQKKFQPKTANNSKITGSNQKSPGEILRQLVRQPTQADNVPSCVCERPKKKRKELN